MNFSALRLFRVSTTILRASSKSNKPYFNPAGHLNADHFVVLDENVKREVYMNRNYGKKGEEVQVIVEKALAQDEQAITNFYVSHFGVNEPINATLKFNSVDGRELLSAIIKESTDNFIIRHDKKLIGCYTLKKGRLETPPRKKKPVEDYGTIIDGGPFKSRKNNLIVALLEAGERNMFDKMESPCGYVYAAMGCMHPKYGKLKVAETVATEIMKWCIKEGARYFIGNMTGDGVVKVYERLPGYECADQYFYADFKDHGTTPLDTLVDGSKNSTIVFYDLKKHAKAYGM